MNQRQKGARGERMWRDQLREAGYTARRGQQFSGGADSPDVICEELAGLHFEVKGVQARNWEGAIEQAKRDAGAFKDWVVAHKKDHKPWRVTISTELFFNLLKDGMDGLKKLPK